MYVTALFVDPRGPYPDMVIDWYDEKRDARTYDGPWPVVAHPPCQLWTNLAHVNYARWGGGHNRPGNDAGCFASALYAIRRWGGVIEHPAGSHAFSHHGLVPPGSEPKWYRRGLAEWTCEVWQSAYGHRARKRTWLYYCGLREPIDPRWEREPGTHQVGWFDRSKPTLGKRESSRTPSDFARYLIDLARGSHGEEDVA